MPEVPEYLTITEASELIRLPVQTLYKYRSREDGPPVRKVGRHLLYPRAPLIAWVEAKAVHA